MKLHGRFTAAVGSAALNVALALILTQQAGATIPATHRPGQDLQSYTVTLGADHHPAQQRCANAIRSRAILAVVLGLLV